MRPVLIALGPKGVVVWWDNLPGQVQDLISGKPGDTENWWDEIAIAIAEALSPFITTLPRADTSRIANAVNDLQQCVGGLHAMATADISGITSAINDLETTVQNPVP